MKRLLLIPLFLVALFLVTPSSAASSPLTTTTISSDSRLGENGWYITAVEVNFSASGSSPIQNITYWLDSGLPQTIEGATGTRTFFQQGQHTLYYYATDTAGLRENPPKQLQFKIDTVAPTNWREFSVIQEPGYNDHTFDLSIKVSDLTSGLNPATAFLQYTTDEGVTWGYFTETDRCNSTWISNGWLAVTVNPNTPGANDVILSKNEIDFCNSNWSVAKKVKFKIKDMAGLESVKEYALNSPWIKTSGGDVHANGEINMMTTGADPSASFIVSSTQFPITNFSSNKGWLVTPYSQIFRPDYNTWFGQLHPAQTLPGGKLPQSNGIGVYLVDSPIFPITSTTKPSATAKFTAIVFVNGDLYVDTSFSLNPSSSLIFVVKGDVKVSSGVESMAGIYLADGKINTSYDKIGKDSLTVDGSLITGDGFDFSRSLGRTENMINPAEIIRFNPYYLINRDLINLLAGEVKYGWREVAP